MNSPKYQKVKDYYDKGLWTAEMVQNAVGRWITQAEADEILDKQYRRELSPIPPSEI